MGRARADGRRDGDPIGYQPLAGGLGEQLAAPPDRVGDAFVREVDLRDGLRLVLDDGFVTPRRSGTEPVMRL